MLRLAACVAFVCVFLLVPFGARAADEQFAKLIDLPTTHTFYRGGYSLGLRVVGNGGMIGAVRVGVADMFLLGLSYGGENVIGAGSVDWNSSVGIDAKLRLAPENGPIPAIAIGYDSRGYGPEVEDGLYAKPSLGFYAVATKTLPFSDYWQVHFGLGRTLEIEKTAPDIFVTLSARFSVEFSVLVEYQYGNDATREDPSDKTSYLNAGLRWVFMEQLEFDFYFRNLIGPSGSPDLVSRSLELVFYDTF